MGLKMEDIENFIWREALKNAIKFEGKADAKAIMGKVMKEHAELRSQSQTLKPLIEQIVADVNVMDIEAQK
jgi:glutamyl-tRNA synthetase